MGRNIKWEPGTYQKVKVKIPLEIHRKYQLILKIKKKTIQQDIQEYIMKSLVD